SRRRPPSPDPVLAVTVLVVPVPLSPVIDAPVGPVDASEKFDLATPVTASENVTVHDTLDALVGFAAALTMEITVGATFSACGMCPHDVGGAASANRAAIHARTSVRDVVKGMCPSSYQRNSTVLPRSQRRCTKGGRRTGGK